VRAKELHKCINLLHTGIRVNVFFSTLQHNLGAATGVDLHIIHSTDLESADRTDDQCSVRLVNLSSRHGEHLLRHYLSERYPVCL